MASSGGIQPIIIAHCTLPYSRSQCSLCRVCGDIEDQCNSAERQPEAGRQTPMVGEQHHHERHSSICDGETLRENNISR